MALGEINLALKKFPMSGEEGGETLPPDGANSYL